MTEDLKAAIKSLKSLSPQLNKATDEVNRLIVAVEKFLSEECSIGITAKVEFDMEDLECEDGEACKVQRKYIGYERASGTFRLCVITEVDTDYENNRHTDETSVTVDVTPLASCPRGDKLEAFAKLPDLLKAIAGKAQEAITKTEASSKAVADLLEAMKS